MKFFRNSVRFLLILGATAASFIGFQFLSERWQVLQAAASAGPFVPYTMETVSMAPDDKGNVRITERRTTAVAGNGSEVWIGTIRDRSKNEDVLLRRYVRPNGQIVTAFDRLGLKMSQFMTSKHLRGRQSKPAEAGKKCRFSYEKDAGEALLAGITVSVSEYQPTPNARQTVKRAIDFGCVAVAIRFESLVDGQWKLQAESMPVFFKGGDPDPSLFDEAFYEKLQEVSPSEAQRRLHAQLGLSETDCPVCYNPEKLRLLDEAYYRNQSPQ